VLKTPQDFIYWIRVSIQIRITPAFILTAVLAKVVPQSLLVIKLHSSLKRRWVSKPRFPPPRLRKTRPTSKNTEPAQTRDSNESALEEYIGAIKS
jgi:hypothetical protein